MVILLHLSLNGCLKKSAMKKRIHNKIFIYNITANSSPLQKLRRYTFDYILSNEWVLFNMSLGAFGSAQLTNLFLPWIFFLHYKLKFIIQDLQKREIFRPTFENHLNYMVALNNGFCFYHINMCFLINIKVLYYICRLLYDK